MLHIENFVREHRNEMDVFTPSAAAWAKIDSGINHPTLIKSGLPWLKYAGVSAVVIAALVYFYVDSSTGDLKTSQPTKQPIAASVVTTPTSEEKTTPAVQHTNDVKTETVISSLPVSVPVKKEASAPAPAVVAESSTVEKGSNFISTEKKTVSGYKVSLCEGLNSTSYDYAPSIIDDNSKSLIFSSMRVSSSNDNASHLYYSSLTDGKWTTPVRIDTAAGNTNNAVITIDKKRKVVLFTRCAVTKNENHKCAISYSFMNGGMVGEPIEVQFEKPDTGNYNYGHPFYSNELDILFFSSDMPGGCGGLDLWFMKYDSKTDSWSKPQNAGKEINTKDDEMFPAMRNGTLYFSSTGHGGFGKFDILKAEKQDGLGWGNVKNMGEPINSDGDDFGITFRNDESGYFSSNRSGGLGEDDIYEFISHEKKSDAPENASISKSPADVQPDNIIQQIGAVLNKESCTEEGEILKISDAILSPNPNSGNFSLEFSSNKKINLTIRIFSSMGQLLINETVSAEKGVYKKEYGLKNAAAGIYYVQILQNCFPLRTEKMVVK